MAESAREISDPLRNLSFDDFFSQAKNGSAKETCCIRFFFGKTIVPNSFQNISVGFIKYVFVFLGNI